MLSHTALNKTYNSHSRRFKLPRGHKFYLKNEQKTNAPPSRALCLFFKCQSENPPYPATLKKIALIKQLAPPRLSFTARLWRRRGQTNVTNVCFRNKDSLQLCSFTLSSFTLHRSDGPGPLRRTRSPQDSPVPSGRPGLLRRTRSALDDPVRSGRPGPLRWVRSLKTGVKVPR